MITLAKISDIITDLSGRLDVNYGDENLIPSDYVQSIFKRFYPDYSFPGTTADEFVSDFNLFNYFESYNLKKSMDAYNATYNPIENYDKNSEIINSFGSFEKNHSEKPRTDTTTMGAVTRTDINQVSPFDSDEFKNSDKSTSTDGEQINTHAIGLIESKDVETSHENKVTEYTHGNIGTTRSQEMVTDEINLRKINIYNDYIARFVHLYLYLIEEVD